MKLLKRTLIATALIAPGLVNGAMLRFDISATTDSILGEIGLLPGSYFVIDTTVSNSSTEPTNSLFSNSIVGGRVETMDPFNGSVVTDITEANSASIIATNDDLNTTWTIPVEGSSSSQSAEMTINFNGLDLYSNLLSDYSFYNDNYIDGMITADTTNIAFDSFSVTTVSPAPVPLPPTFYLMAASLGLLLWRSNLSFSNIRELLTSR